MGRTLLFCLLHETKNQKVMWRSVKRTVRKIKTKSKSIKTTLLIGMVGLTVAVSILCGVATGFILYINSNSNMLERASSSATAYNHSVKNAIDNYKIKAEAIAQNTKIGDATLPISSRISTLTSLAKQYGFVDIMVADSKGQTTNNTNVSNCDYFKKSIAGQTYVSCTVVRD